jgi:hypothetical protein
MVFVSVDRTGITWHHLSREPRWTVARARLTMLRACADGGIDAN